MFLSYHPSIPVYEDTVVATTLVHLLEKLFGSEYRARSDEYLRFIDERTHWHHLGNVLVLVVIIEGVASILSTTTDERSIWFPIRAILRDEVGGLTLPLRTILSSDEDIYLSAHSRFTTLKEVQPHCSQPEFFPSTVLSAIPTQPHVSNRSDLSIIFMLNLT